jgi:anion-transporting  ArsA/GET3 family ATPase
MARITGGSFLEDMARLLSELNELFGGFRERATRVKAALRDEGVRFLLVTSPAPASVDEARFFAERLQEAGMPRGAFVVNRYRGPEDLAGTPDEWAARVNAALGQGGTDRGTVGGRDGGTDSGRVAGAPPDEGSLARRAVRAYQESERQAAWNALHVAPLLAHDSGSVPVVLVPERDEDVHDLRALSEVARGLVGAL